MAITSSESDLDPAARSPSALAAFDTLFAGAPMPCALTRRDDGRIVAVNPAWSSLTGMAPDQILGMTTLELGLWQDAKERGEALRSLPLRDHPQQWRLPTGRSVSVRLQLSALQGEPGFLLCCVIDAEPEARAVAERDHTHALLLERLELHDAIERVARVGHWRNGPNPDEVIWSPGLFEIAGWEPRPIVTRAQARATIHPDDLPRWLAARNAADGREVIFRCVRPDGQIRWLRSMIGLTSQGGSGPSDFGVMQDITAEHEAGQKLAEQLALLQNIASRVPGLMYQARQLPDGSTRFQYVNDAAKEMLELTPEELQQDARLLFSRLHPDDRPQLIDSLRRSTRELMPWHLVYRVVLPSKGVRWHHVDAVPQREADGSVLWHGFVMDVSESRRVAQQLERQHRMIEAIRQAQATYISADDKRQAFEGLLDALLNVTGSAYGFIGEVIQDEQDQPAVRMHAITNIAWDEESRRAFDEQREAGMLFRNPDTLFGHALVSGEPVIANHPDSDPRRGGRPQGHPPLASFLGVPIKVGEEMVAMVGLANQPGGYSEADIEFLQPMLGAVRQLVLAWRAQTERRRTRRELQTARDLLAEKSEALQTTLDSISQGLVRVDAQARVTFYNQRLLELLDLPEELLRHHPPFSAVLQHQLDRGDFGAQFEWVEPSVRETMSALDWMATPDFYWRHTRDGRTLEVRTLRLPAGGMVRTFTDVTSYFKVQEDLRHQRQRLAWVLAATRAGVWEVDLADMSLKVDERWAEIVGYRLADLQPLTYATWESLVHPDDLRRVNAERDRHLAGHSPSFECDVRMRHRDGHWVWVNTRGRVNPRDARDSTTRLSGTHIDISERVAAQEEIRALNSGLEQRVCERTAELERTMRDMEAISYSIAHDLRAPLRSVNGFASVILEEESGLSPGGRLMFERIAKASHNMGRMITDMLELLRVVRVELTPQPVDMAELARSVWEGLSPAGEAQLQVQAMPTALGDPILLRQVLSNLLDNAVKYARPEVGLQLVVGHDAAQGAYFVRDNGIGFDMAHAGKLFGLFQRLPAAGSVPGMGIGLAIVARIIERHGGQVWAEAAPGQGATFWLRLPLA